MRVPFTLGDAVKILVICLIVGFIVKALGFGPVEFWLAVRDLFDWMWRNAHALLRGIAEYILIGAAVVVPILIVRYLLQQARRR
jgi:hypothetical protein